MLPLIRLKQVYKITYPNGKIYVGIYAQAQAERA